MRRNIRFLVPLFALALFAALARGEEPIVATAPAPAGLAKAAFAGGCFWCMQGPYDGLAGVVSTTVGYTGGGKPNPTYHEVSAGGLADERALHLPPQFPKADEPLRHVLHHRCADPRVSGGVCL